MNVVAEQEVKCESCGTTDKALFTSRQLTGKVKRVRFRCRNCRRRDDYQRINSSPREFLKGRYHAIHRRDLKKEIELDQLMDMWHAQKGLCAVTGIPMTWGYDYEGDQQNNSRRHTNVSIDRIDSDGDYTQDNIRLVCARVNMMRNNLEDYELYFWSRVIAEGMQHGEKE